MFCGGFVCANLCKGFWLLFDLEKKREENIVSLDSKVVD
jgi:hypothetical protein